MPELQRSQKVPTNDGTGSSLSVSSGEFFSSALVRKRYDIGYDQEDLGVTRKTESLVPERASIFDNLFALLSIGTFVADIGMDIVVARQYYITRDHWWFGLTITFIIVPAIVLQFFSLRWYHEDQCEQLFGSYALHMILLGPVERYLNAFYYGCKTYLTKKVDESDFTRYLTEWRDITMLRLFEAFLEAGPQTVLQLYVLASLNVFKPERDWQTALAAVTSVISIAWAIASYSHALRLCCAAKGLSWFGYIFQIWYRLFMIASRVVALVLFASVFKEWIFLFVGLHFTAMFIWLNMENTNFCPANVNICQTILEKGFNSVVAIVYIFCFLNIHEGATRHRIVAYYAVFFVENATLTAFWFPNRTIHGKVMYAALGIIIGGYLLGVVCLLFYYKYFHPSLDITEGWLPCQCCCCSPQPKANGIATEDENVEKPVTETKERPKLLALDVPRALKFKSTNPVWRHSLLATSPGTPIDVELPFRFSKPLRSLSKPELSTGIDVPLYQDREMQEGSTHSCGDSNFDKSNNIQFPTSTTNQTSPSLPSRNDERRSLVSTRDPALMSEINHNYDSHVYPSDTCSEIFYPPSRSSSRTNDRHLDPFVTVHQPLPRTSTDSTTSDYEESLPLMKNRHDPRQDCPVVTYQVPLHLASPGKERSSLYSLGNKHNYIPVSDSTSISSDSKRYSGDEYFQRDIGVVNPGLSRSPLAKYSPLENYSQVSVNYEPPSEDFSSSVEGISPSDYLSDAEGDLDCTTRNPMSNLQRRGRSKSLPGKDAIRQAVVDWMVDKLQVERLNDVNNRPRSDLGTYTVTVNVKGDDYYTSLV